MVARLSVCWLLAMIIGFIVVCAYLSDNDKQFHRYYFWPTALKSISPFGGKAVCKINFIELVHKFRLIRSRIYLGYIKLSDFGVREREY